MHDLRGLDREVQKILAALARVAAHDHDGVHGKVDLLLGHEGVDQLQSRVGIRVRKIRGELAMTECKNNHLLPVQGHHTTIGIHNLDTVVDLRVVRCSDHETDRLFVIQRIQELPVCDTCCEERQ